MAKSSRGFTLIEIIIAVAIIGILVAIAVPSYQNHLKKGRRAEAQGFLVQVAQKQTAYMLDARTYALGSTALTDLSMTAPTTVTNFYDITVTPAAATTPPTFTVTATPKAGPQSDDGTLSLTSAGVKRRDVGGTDKGW